MQKDGRRRGQGACRLFQRPHPQHPLHFVVVGQREDVQALGPVLKQIPQFEGGTALKSLGAELTDTQAGMLVGAAKRIPEIVQGQ